MRRKCGLAIALGVTLAAVACLLATPFPRATLARYPAGQVITDRAGRPLRVTLGPGQVDCRPTYRYRAEDWIGKALMAAEDGRFRHHCGIDILALARAAGQNLRARRVISGASTLTTQVIRLAEPRPRTLRTKFIEAYRAIQMECLLTKEEILEQYLNRAPFGGNIIGIEAAAQRYYRKSPHDLSLAEAALLAGLPQSPSRFRPDRRYAAARYRQAYVLDRMAALGMITVAQRAEARRQSVRVRSTAYPFESPHFCDLIERSKPASVPTLRTTLDADLQALAARTLERHVSDLGVAGGAVVILEVETGAIRALAGSPDFFDAEQSGQVNGARARRSAGSTLKPFAYALAFERGLATPETVLPDVPRIYRDYEPANFDARFLGLVSAREALILSLNMPALDLTEQLGPALLHQTLRHLGFTTFARPAASYGLGLVLGNGEVTLLDLVNAYACLARGGIYQPYRLAEGGQEEQGTPIFSAAAAWLVAEVLSGNERGMDATGHTADARLPRLAWKTGTSSGFRDAWTVAYNPAYVVGVWIGNPDGSSSPQLVGRSAAAPAAWDVFRRLYPNNDAPWFQPPPDVRARPVCAVSGESPGPYCAATKDDWFIAKVSSWRICAAHARGPQAEWPPAVAAFLQAQASPAEAPHRLRITTPAQGATYRILGDWSATQSIPLTATGSAHWFVDQDYIGEGHRLFWPLAPGRHIVVCSDTRGSSDQVDILVE